MDDEEVKAASKGGYTDTLSDTLSDESVEYMQHNPFEFHIYSAMREFVSVVDNDYVTQEHWDVIGLLLKVINNDIVKRLFK